MDGRAADPWSHDEDRWERWGDHGKLSVYLLDGGRPVYVVGVEDRERSVERWTWEGEHIVRVDRARAQPTSWPSSLAIAAVYDGDLQQVLRATSRGDYRDDNRLDPDAVMDALRGALVTAAALVPDRVTWDARSDRPEPMPEHPDAGAAAAAFERATLAAVAASTVRDPFCVVVYEARDDRDRTYPPHVLVVAESWRAGMLAAGRTGTAVLHEIWEAVDVGHAESVSLAGFLDDDGFDACRVLRTAFGSSGTREQREAGRRFAAGDRARARGCGWRARRSCRSWTSARASIALLRDVAPERPGGATTRPARGAGPPATTATSTTPATPRTPCAAPSAAVVVTAGPPAKGELRVTTNPALPSQILVDGVPRDTFGLNWLDLPPGTYTVSFDPRGGLHRPGAPVGQRRRRPDHHGAWATSCGEGRSG